METTGVLGLFGLFGIVCGFYVSVVGFAVTAVAIVSVLGVMALFVGGPMGGWMPAGAFVAMQVATSSASSARPSSAISGACRPRIRAAPSATCTSTTNRGLTPRTGG